MRRAGVGLIAAVLALSGCKSTDPKSGDDKTPGGIAARNRAKDKDKDAKAANGSWLDDGVLPGAGTSVPKGNSSGNPADPNFNAKAEAQDAIGGRVFSPAGSPARNVFIRIELVGAPPGGPAAMGIYTDNNGYFFTRGLKPGRAYDLTAEATQDGKALTGVVQTTVPRVNLAIELRGDLPASAGGLPPPKGAGDIFPPTPKPTERPGGYVPPKPPADGAWVPGASTPDTPPATVTPKPTATGGAGTPLPPPDDLSFPPGMPPAKPENVADGPKDPFKPVPAAIPGPTGAPPVPPLPTLPPSFSPSGGGRSAMNTTTGSAPGKLALVDTLDRPWSLDSVRPGDLVLVEFVTSECVYCKQAIPVLKDLQSRYGANGLQTASVMCDNLPLKDRAALAAKYSRNNNLNYAIYVEPGDAGSVRDRFDVESYPTAVLLDSTGRVLWKGHPGKKAELETAVRQNLGK